ncbi:TetR/AcrR family transcriptional regulator [Acinetobacter ihumii]|uniref:TetR/AcrR family transcriptional regulator n=1 Tax=Acinetobacter ihumii TaxID=2483802 RepID=UPI00102F2E89|nr:TetR/AcrR family transcriptional regulator [Acinetobacter ihumii]
MSKAADKILMTAELLFNRDSFSAVGVDLIRDESGCSKTTMYHYFKNKQQLVVQVLQQRDQRFRQSLQRFVGEAQDLEAIDKIYDWHIDWFQQNHFKGCLFVRAVAESTQAHELHRVSKAHKQWIYQFIATKVQNFQQSEAIVELVYNFIESLISRYLVEGFDVQHAEMTKKLMYLLIQKLQ